MLRAEGPPGVMRAEHLAQLLGTESTRALAGNGAHCVVTVTVINAPAQPQVRAEHLTKRTGSFSWTGRKPACVHTRFSELALQSLGCTAGQRRRTALCVGAGLKNPISYVLCDF